MTDTTKETLKINTLYEFSRVYEFLMNKYGILERLIEYSNKYANSLVYTELGESTTLVEIPEVDFEALFIGTNCKFIRLGSFIKVTTANSRPPELARERVNERLEKFLTGLKLETPTRDPWDSDTDSNGNEVDYIQYGNDWYSQGQYAFFQSTMKEGKCMVNRNTEHKGWFFSNRTEKYISIDDEALALTRALGNRYSKCKGCDSTLIDTGGIGLCPVCRTKYDKCYHCEEWHKKDEGVYRGNSFYCKECAKKPLCKGCGYPISEGSTLCDRCSSVHHILDYHSSIGRQDESGGSRFKVGLEVEKEDEDVLSRIDVSRILETTGWIVERDSSLGNDGFEMVSPIYPLDTVEIRKRLQPLRAELSAIATGKCGGHIHVSDTERTPYEILLDIRGYLPLLYGMYPDRATNVYCEAKETDVYVESGHRQALNITDKTLEFRIFPAVKNIEQIIFRLEIVDYMLKHKETDVVKVGSMLLDEDNELFQILANRIGKEKVKQKAESFIDFTNYLERDALVLDKGQIRRVIRIPKIKEEKNKALEENIKRLSDEYRARRPRGNRRSYTMEVSDYGYFANLSRE